MSAIFTMFSELELDTSPLGLGSISPTQKPPRTAQESEVYILPRYYSLHFKLLFLATKSLPVFTTPTPSPALFEKNIHPCSGSSLSLLRFFWRLKADHQGLVMNGSNICFDLNLLKNPLRCRLLAEILSDLIWCNFH